MKIAIPVKMQRDNPPLAPLFGKAKWFALVEDGKADIVPNPVHGGRAVTEWLANEGVEAIIFQEMGTTPYEMIKAKGNISLYHAGYDRVLLEEVLKQFEENRLLKIDENNIAEIIARHEGKHAHSH